MYNKVLDTDVAALKRIVGDDAVLQRHVEVAAQEYFLSGNVDVLDGFLVVHTLFLTFLYFKKKCSYILIIV